MCVELRDEDGKCRTKEVRVRHTHTHTHTHTNEWCQHIRTSRRRDGLGSGHGGGVVAREPWVDGNLHSVPMVDADPEDVVNVRHLLRLRVEVTIDRLCDDLEVNGLAALELSSLIGAERDNFLELLPGPVPPHPLLRRRRVDLQRRRAPLSGADVSFRLYRGVLLVEFRRGEGLAAVRCEIYICLS
jgi:hypothetical protein